MVVLIIGLGSIAKKHIAALQSLEKDVKIFALRSIKDSESYLDIINIYDLSILTQEKVDFIIISNPTYSHFNSINQLADFKVPLFIEKPPLHTLIDSNILLDKIKESNTLTYVAFNLRFNPCLIYLKNNIDKFGRINEVNVYCGSYLPNWRPNVNYKEVYSSKKSEGGGVHLDLIHELDYTVWIFGLPNYIKGNFSSKSSLEISSFDYAQYFMEYDNYNITVILNYYRVDSKRTVEILTENDTITLDLINCNITSLKNGIIFENKQIDNLYTYKEQMRYFINKLKHNSLPMNTLDESLKILKLSLLDEL